MRRFMWVLLPLPITLYVLYMIMYVSMLQNMSQSANDAYANAIANYCSDAATAELLDTADLGLDYATTGEVTVDPELAIDEYGSTLCLALGYQPTEEMIDNVLRDHVKVLYVCGYDGYYVYQVDLVGGTDSRNRALQGSFKMPYTYERESDNKLFALTLNGNKCWEFDPSVPSLKREQSSGLSQEMTNHIINTRISDDMNKRITDLYTDSANGWSNRVYLPSGLSTISSTNPITGPTVLALVDNIEGSLAFGIGGTKLEDTRKVAGYIRDGRSYYCYVDQLPTNVTPSDLFDSIDEAAAGGYSPDPVNLLK